MKKIAPNYLQLVYFYCNLVVDPEGDGIEVRGLRFQPSGIFQVAGTLYLKTFKDSFLV